ncbi:MAG: alpha/beta hydrolase [Acidimicrobiia bacterium]|nr:alpha/beta hydrolase [Acidimicrobiia bacterium]
MSDALTIGPGSGSASVGPLELHVATHGATERRHEETLLFVHGAGCGSWVWENFLPYFADRGWDGAAVSWRGHPPSPMMAPDDFVELTLHDYVEDVDTVAAAVDGHVIVVAHSVGGLIGLKHAEIGFTQPVGLALLAPAPPSEVGGYNFPTYGTRYPVPPFDPATARTLFFHNIEDDALERYVGMLCDESPTALNSASRNDLDVEPQRVSGPLCVISADHDMIQGFNSGIDREVARVYGAEYFQVRGFGHMLPIESGWETVAALLERWLRRAFPA